MGCWYRPQLNTISSIWYCLCFLMLQGYLLYAGLARYSLLVEGGRKQFKYQSGNFLSFYVTFHGLIIALLPIFAFAAIFKVGNLANDGEKIGDKQQSVIHTSGSKCCVRLKSGWVHGLPVSQTVHIIIATAFLVSTTLVETEFLEQDANLADELWFTELNMLKSSPYYQGSEAPLEWNISEREFRNPNRLVTVRTFGISLTFVNYISALVAFAIVYPSVFWRVNRAFSFIFSCHLMVHAVAAVFSFVSYSTLRRIYLASYAESSSVKGSPFLLQEPFLFVLYLSTATVMLLATIVVYSYGYTKFCLSVLMKRGLYRVHRKVYAIYCEGYSPHIAALVTLVMMILCKAPTLYDLMVLYQHEQRSVLLSCIVADVSYLFLWILLWLGLTLKRDWIYNVCHSTNEIGNLLDLRTEEGKDCNDDTLIVLCKDYAFATDSECKKVTITQAVEKCGKLTNSDIYWPKVHENDLRPSNALMAKQSPNDYKDTLHVDKILLAQTETMPASRRRIGDSHLHIQDSLRDSSKDLVSTFGTLPKMDKSAAHYLQGSNASLAKRRDKTSLEEVGLAPAERSLNGIQYASVQRPAKQEMIGKSWEISDVGAKQNNYAVLQQSCWSPSAMGRKEFHPIVVQTTTAQQRPYSLAKVKAMETLRAAKNPPPPPSAVKPYSANMTMEAPVQGTSPLKSSYEFASVGQPNRATLDRVKQDKAHSTSSRVSRGSESKLNLFSQTNDTATAAAASASRPSRNVAGSATDVMWNTNPLYRIQPNRHLRGDYVDTLSNNPQKPIVATLQDPLSHFTTSIV